MGIECLLRSGDNDKRSCHWDLMERAHTTQLTLRQHISFVKGKMPKAAFAITESRIFCILPFKKKKKRRRSESRKKNWCYFAYDTQEKKKFDTFFFEFIFSICFFLLFFCSLTLFAKFYLICWCSHICAYTFKNIFHFKRKKRPVRAVWHKENGFLPWEKSVCHTHTLQLEIIERDQMRTKIYI